MPLTMREIVEPELARIGTQPLAACEPTCTCQEISNFYGADDQAKDFFATPNETKKHWLALKCATMPVPIQLRPQQLPPPPPPLPNQGGVNQRAKVCYFVKVRGETASSEAGASAAGRQLALQTWAQPPEIARRTWFVEDGHAAPSRIDVATQTIQLAVPSVNDRFGLSEKTIAMWDFVGATYAEGWADECEWFAHVDDDSWINVPLVERRLSCLNPFEEIYLGEAMDFAAGGFYLQSTGVMRLVPWILRNYWTRRHLTRPPGPFDDRCWGSVLWMHNITVQNFFRHEQYRREGHFRTDPISACMASKVKGALASQSTAWSSANPKCALDFIAKNVTAAMAFPEHPKQGEHQQSGGEGYPMIRLSRCVAYWHGHKVIKVMKAVHTAMQRLEADTAEFDYRLPREKSLLPADDPYCVAGLLSGASSAHEHRNNEIRQCAIRRHADAAIGS